MNEGLNHIFNIMPQWRKKQPEGTEENDSGEADNQSQTDHENYDPSHFFLSLVFFSNLQKSMEISMQRAKGI